MKYNLKTVKITTAKTNLTIIKCSVDARNHSKRFACDHSFTSYNSVGEGTIMPILWRRNLRLRSGAMPGITQPVAGQEFRPLSDNEWAWAPVTCCTPLIAGPKGTGYFASLSLLELDIST